MAILSRHPIASVNPIRLPDGNEPRIALMVKIAMPAGDTIAVVDVHFDWVTTDSFIFASPAAAWTAREVRVIDERLASDHRPVLAVFSRR